MGLFDVGKYNWTNAKTACDELVLNGYTDWRLPSNEELKFIYNNAYKFHHHRSQTSNSQSSSSGNNSDIYKCDVLYGEYTFEYNNSSYVMTLLNK